MFSICLGLHAFLQSPFHCMRCSSWGYLIFMSLPVESCTLAGHLTSKLVHVVFRLQTGNGPGNQQQHKSMVGTGDMMRAISGLAFELGSWVYRWSASLLCRTGGLWSDTMNLASPGFCRWPTGRSPSTCHRGPCSV